MVNSGSDDAVLTLVRQRTKGIEERLQMVFVASPAADGASMNLLSDLADAGGAHGSAGAVEGEAGRIPG